MRMTKRNKELLRLYLRERREGNRASNALHAARTRQEWSRHEVAEYSSGEPIDAKRGDVRLRIVPDDCADFDDLCGDTFNPVVNSDIPESRLERERKEFEDKVNRDGVWGVIGEYFDGEVWHQSDSCFGFVGDDWKRSGYDVDIMAQTLASARAVKVCRCCKRPKIRKARLSQ
jgi:hypothetical protein